MKSSFARSVASAVVPAAIANAYFMPKHLLPRPEHAFAPQNATIRAGLERIERARKGLAGQTE